MKNQAVMKLVATLVVVSTATGSIAQAQEPNEKIKLDEAVAELAPACWNPVPKVEAVKFNSGSFNPLCDYLVSEIKVKYYRVLPNGLLIEEK